MSVKSLLKSALCGMAIISLATACSSDDFAESSDNMKAQSELKLVKVPVSIGTSNTATRAMMVNENGYTIYDFDEMAAGGTSYDLILCLRNKTTGQLVYTRDLNTTITAKADNSGFTFSLPNAKVYIEDGTKLSDYDACAIFNTGIDSEDFEKAFLPADGATTTKLDLSTLPYTTTDHSTTGMAVPMYSSYENSKISGSSLTLDFYMMGTVITAQGNTNPLCSPIRLNSISLRKSNVKTGEANFKFGEEDSSGNPKLNFTSTDECTLTFPGVGYTLQPYFEGQSSENDMLRADFWCMPVSTDDFYSNYDINFSVLSDDGSIAEGDYMTYANNTTTTPTFEGGFKSGYCYQLNVALPESDLMITEFEQYDNEWGDKKDYYNLSMIEIYNPTNEVKNLLEYGIVRQFRLGSNPAYTGFTDIETLLDNARVQDLYIGNSNTIARNASNQLGTKNWTNSYTLLADWNGSYSAAKTYSKTIYGQTYSWTLKPEYLAPGQSIVIFASGVKRIKDESGTTAYGDYLPTASGNKLFNSTYLAQAIAKGACKYAIAVDNGFEKNISPYSISGYDEAGTMNFAHGHNPILMKLTEKKNAVDDSSWKFEILDAGFSLAPTNTEASTWVSNYPETATSKGEYKAPRYMVRNASAMYPYTIRLSDDGHFTIPGEQSGDDLYSAFDWQWQNTSSSALFDMSLYAVLSPGTKFKISF